MGEKSIYKPPARKTVSCKRTVTRSRLTITKKKIVSADLLKMSMNNQEECSFSKLQLFKRSAVQSYILNRKLEKIYPSLN